MRKYLRSSMSGSPLPSFSLIALTTPLNQTFRTTFAWTEVHLRFATSTKFCQRVPRSACMCWTPTAVRRENINNLMFCPPLTEREAQYQEMIRTTTDETKTRLDYRLGARLSGSDQRGIFQLFISTKSQPVLFSTIVILVEHLGRPFAR